MLHVCVWEDVSLRRGIVPQETHDVHAPLEILENRLESETDSLFRNSPEPLDHE